MSASIKGLASELLIAGDEGDENRREFLLAYLRSHLANQIKMNRIVLRGWNQGQLADKLKTRQSAISRYEQSSYGKFTLRSLVDLAVAFGCGLQVRFVPFGHLLVERESETLDSLPSVSFDKDQLLVEASQTGALPSVLPEYPKARKRAKDIKIPQAINDPAPKKLTFESDSQADSDAIRPSPTFPNTNEKLSWKADSGTAGRPLHSGFKKEPAYV